MANFENDLDIYYLAWNNNSQRKENKLTEIINNKKFCRMVVVLNKNGNSGYWRLVLKSLSILQKNQYLVMELF